MTEPLEELAAALGIEPVWTDNAGIAHRVPVDTLRALIEALGVPAGNDRAVRDSLTVFGGARGRSAAPRRQHLRCPTPAELGLGRVYGVACQLYGLRREPDPGIGDFADLERLVERAADAGCDFVAVSPLHALFPADPEARSPYAPSHRQFLNVLAIAPERVTEQGCSPAAAVILQALHSLTKPPDLVDYRHVGRTKLAFLDAAFADFSSSHLGPAGPSERGRAFLKWRRAAGPALENHCRFDALHEAMLRRDRALWAFRTWPAGLRHAGGAEVEAFAREHANRVTFFAWLQWLAHTQLEQAAAAARARGMRIGLYRDLAVGLHPSGSAAWSEPGALVGGVSIGAPPDAFNPHGQSWGLAPYSPRWLHDHGYEPLASDFRANMAAAGALRIDHVMGLLRQFWIPDGATAAEGAYVRFPFDPLADLLASEAHARSCLVVGEDLGTVPAGFRGRMTRRGMLGIRVLWFERTADGRFRPPGLFPELAAASVSTHDLPTLRGFLEGRDIDWRERLGILSGETAAAERKARQRDLLLLRRRLVSLGLAAPREISSEEFAVAVHRYLARTRSALAVAQIEDLAGEIEQANLPGTVDEHPNWRRRLRLTVDALFDSAPARAILDGMRTERPR